MRQISNITVGKPDTTVTRPSHVRGVNEGNEAGALSKEAGIFPYGRWGARGTARRSTGINADKRNPIDPRSPNLSPS